MSVYDIGGNVCLNIILHKLLDDSKCYELVMQLISHIHLHIYGKLQHISGSDHAYV